MGRLPHGVSGRPSFAAINVNSKGAPWQVGAPLRIAAISSKNLLNVVCVLYNGSLFEVGLGAKLTWRVGD